MLLEYFMLDIRNDTGAAMLHSLPLIVDNITPQAVLLPMFLLRLGTEVEWETEKECFQTLACEFAEFYAPLSATDSKQDEDKDVAWIVQHVLFPAFRSMLQPSQRIASDGSVLEIASLENLYKVFERC